MTSPRRLGIAAAATAVVVGVLASGRVWWGELGLTEAVNDLPAPMIDVLRVVMQLGARPAIALVAVVAVVVASADWRRVALGVVVAGGLAWAASSITKDVVERPRAAAFSDEIVVRDGAGAFGWPSTHVSIATASLTAAAFSARRRPTVAVAVGAVVGVGRMAVGVHLPLDVVGGLAVGVLAAAVSVELVER